VIRGSSTLRLRQGQLSPDSLVAPMQKLEKKVEQFKVFIFPLLCMQNFCYLLFSVVLQIQASFSI